MKPSPPPASSDKKPLLGDLLVKANAITAEQLQEVLAYQAGLKKYRPLGLLLVDKKLITIKQLNRFLDTYRKRPCIGEILVSTKAITREQLEVAMQFKKSGGQRLGQVLIKLGYIKEDDLQTAVAIQRNTPFMDLDRTTFTPNLSGFIPVSYAQRNRVVPIHSTPADLTIAVEDPTNFALMSELQTLTKLQVHVVTSTKDMISRAIQRVYVTNQLAGDLVIEEGFEFAESGKAF
jgi:hypothetical protein